MDETPATTVRPRGRLRLRLRLGLRALMLAIVMIALAFGWVAHRARVQRDAIAAILQPRTDRMGSVLYDWQFKANPAVPSRQPAWMGEILGTFDDQARPPGPKWLRDALGPDLFDTPVQVNVGGVGVDDELLGHIGKLRGVKVLTVHGRADSRLTPAGMAQVRHLDRLEGLVVGDGLVGTRGFVAGLAGKSGLRRLWLPGAAITDDDMAVIGGLTALEILQADGRNVTDRGFAHVARLKSLAMLDLAGARVTDLAPVAGLAQLDVLALAPPRTAAAPDLVGPASLEPLRGLVRATQIVLGPTRAGDRDMDAVAALPRLFHVVIGGKGITEAGLARLAASRSLGSIWLTDASITDLRPLGPRLAALVSLAVEGSPLTDAGVEPLARMAPRLGDLTLIGAEVTDAGLAHVAGLPALWKLRIDRASITDAGLARLASARLLEDLSLSGVGLTDASVPAFASFPALKTLHLDRSGITPAGVARLRKALPRVRIATGRPPG